MNRRRAVTASVALICAVVLISAGWFYFSGAYDRWSDGRSLAEACDGALDAGEVRAALGSDALRGGAGQPDLLTDGETGRITICRVKDRISGQAVDVDVHWGSRMTAAATALRHRFVKDPRIAAVPVGNGWHGAVVSDDGELYGAVELACSNKRGESLIVNLHTRENTKDPDQRRNVARLATSAARSAAQHYDCASQPGKPVERISPDPVRHPVPLTQTKGTCAVVVRDAEPAKKAGAVSVAEAPTDPDTPAEDCYLRNAEGMGLYRLTALYGNFANGPRHGSERDLAGDSGFGEGARYGYATAACPRDKERSLYVITAPVWTNRSPDSEFAHAALKAFAEESARNHGCTDVRMP
ncbi:hypothetical protein [Streptomyces sp. NPDC049555]|uniref:hypothetical protein n=1 Tax=unclassified Streptomyces TaxID=2593676 RepID=UPI00342D8336